MVLRINWIYYNEKCWPYKTDSGSPLYFVFNNLNGYIIQESNSNKYLIFASMDKNRKVLKRYTELWTISCKLWTNWEIEAINGVETIEYENDFIKIRFESNDGLLLGNVLSISSMVRVTKSVFRKDNKDHPQVY